MYLNKLKPVLTEEAKVCADSVCCGFILSISASHLISACSHMCTQCR